MNHKSRHRRKRRSRLIVAPSEQTSEYPGFFVLPRSDQQAPSRAGQLKAIVVVLLVLGGFISAVAYFFFLFGATWTDPVGEPAPFISDPKSLHTNINDGGPWRR